MADQTKEAPGTEIPTAAALLSSGAGADGGSGGEKAGGTAAAGWADDLPGELKELVSTKGWKSPLDALASYRSLESVMGAEKAGRSVLVLPKDDAAAEEWGAVFDKLGRPKDAAGYGLDKLEGADADFAKWAGETFHAAGITDRQARAVAENWQAYQAELAQAETDRFLAASKADFDGLRKELGQAFDARMELARRFTAAAGFSGEELASIERVIGTRAMLERFMKMGASLGEDSLPDGARGAGGALSADGAKAEIEQLKTDRDFQRKVREGDREARERWDRLHQAAYAG